MTHNTRSILLVVMMSFVLGCGSSSPEEDMAILLQDGLDSLHAHGLSGVVAELNDGDQRFLARSGVASLDSEEPVAFDSHFRMGSNTKTFVSVVVLQLAGEGALTLEDTVDQWLPGVVSGNGNDGTQITIRQLLQHTSGLYNYTNDIAGLFSAGEFLEFRHEHVEPDDLLAIALEHEPRFAPGMDWEYSNTNYVLAGMIIESVTGRDWRSEVQSRIAEPLGLQHTFDPGDQSDLPSPHARGYEQFSSGEPLIDVTSMNQTWADAAGSLITTTEDLAKFWRALQQGALLQPEQMSELQDTVPAPPFAELWPGTSYGLGIMWFPTSCGGGYWSHGGDTMGFATRNAASDDGSRVAIISLFTQRADAAPAIVEETLQLMDEIMCAD